MRPRINFLRTAWNIGGYGARCDRREQLFLRLADLVKAAWAPAAGPELVAGDALTAIIAVKVTDTATTVVDVVTTAPAAGCKPFRDANGDFRLPRRAFRATQ
jgi:hypothetical protein